MTPTLPLALGTLVVLAILAAPLVRVLGRDAGWVLGLGFAGTLALLVPAAGPALNGEPATWAVDWVPSLVGEATGQFALRLDALSWLFVLLVLGIGALVLIYTARYLEPTAGSARLYVLLTAFAAAMLTLVLADDILVLYIGWELTSVISFLLIGGDGIAGSAPARRAFVVTALGGLALLGALVLLANAAGSTSLTTILSSPEVAEASTLPWAAGLLLLAVGTKSALLPFGFWLRGAMVAPTPISTYLHAATMVKAGIFLLALTTPLTSEVSWWAPVVVTLGLATTVLGGIQALRALDLKSLLAGSTVSQLGFIAATLAIGSEVALVAGLLHTVAHAAFKASLFLVTGVVDHTVHTRDLRELGGLRRAMPASATIAALAGLSMAGVPPLLGFVSKEEVLDGFLEISPLALVAVAATAVLTVAYSLRFVVGAFAGPGGPAAHRAHEAPTSFLAAPAVVAAVGVVGGLVLGPLDGLVGAAASTAAGGGASIDAELALWHGLTPALGASVAVLVAGGGLWWVAGRARTVTHTGALDGARLYDRINAGVLAGGLRAGRPMLPLRPRIQAAWVLATLVGVLGAASLLDGTVTAPVGAGSLAEWGLVAVMGVTLALFGRVRSRLGAAALLGSVGFLLTGFFVLERAPDLALTQVLVESMTVVLVVLVFRRLPDAFEPWPRGRRALAGVVAVASGLIVVALGAALLGPRPRSDVASYYLTQAEPVTGGTNVVNTILVDFRALDTLGEITVLVVAAIGVYVVLRARPRAASREAPPPVQPAEPVEPAGPAEPTVRDHDATGPGGRG